MKVFGIRDSVSSVAVAVAIIAVTTPAAAQDVGSSVPPPEAGANDSAGENEEIVVTAQFREQNLQQTPIAITAVSADMLEARSQTNIQEITSQAPNVTLRPGSANFGPSLVSTIRGVGQYDFNPAVEPGVGLYVDDVYYATLTGSIFDLLDLDRVEVLRGPQGTLAGRNSIGGAIKLYSQRPEGDGSGSVSAAYGSRDRLDLRASADFNIAPNLDMRIAGVAKQQDGYVRSLDFGCVNPPGSPNNPAVDGVQPLRPQDDCVLDRQGEVGYQAVRGQLRYRPSDTVEINIIGDYTHENRSPAGGVLLAAIPSANPATSFGSPAVPYDSRFLCGEYCNYANFLNPADPANGYVNTTRAPQTTFDGWGISGQVDVDLSEALSLTSITAYRQYEALFTNDDDYSPLPVTSSRSDLDFWFVSQELRLNGNIGETIDYTVGGYYSSQKSVYATIQDLRWAGLQFASLGDPVPAKSKAAFAHAAWRATEKLTLIAGLRYSDESKDYTYSRFNADGSCCNPIVGGLSGQTGSYSGNRIDYRANFQYQWSSKLMTYAQFSTGFKGGGVNPRPYVPGQVQPFGPETIDAYEVGLKSDLFDRRARLNISAFFNNYKGIQLTLLSCPQFSPPVPNFPCALPANAGDAHVKGIEVETTLRPIDGLLIDGSLSYLDFKYQRIDPAAGGPAGVQLSDVAPFTSEWKWSAGVQYTIELDAAGTLTPRLDAAYQSSFYTNAANAATNHVPGFTVANARLTWRNADSDLDVSLEVTNLFDKYYLNSVFDLTGSGGPYVTGMPGRPREWAVVLTKRF